MSKRCLAGSCIIVLLFGVLQGCFIWNTYNGVPSRLYPLSFDGADWIVPPTETPQGYYRLEYFIPSQVEEAWIQVAASESYQLYVNHQLVTSNNYVSLNVSSVNDLTHRLQGGKNIIAIKVVRKSYPGAAQLAVKGAYKDESGHWHTFLSNDSWKVAPYEDRNGDILWYAEDFDMAHWAHAKVTGTVTSGEVYPIDIHPDVITTPPTGQWIWHQKIEARSVYFEKSVDIPAGIHGAWLRVAADKSYTLFVNGVKVGDRNVFNEELNIYNVTSLLKSRQNTIGVGVQGESSSVGFLLDGYFSRRGSSGFFVKTDSTWKSIAWIAPELNLPGPDDPRWASSVVLAEYLSPPWGSLFKNLVRYIPTLDHRIERWGMALLVMFPIIIIVGCLWYFTGMFIHGLTRIGFVKALILDSLTHIPPLLFLFFIFLLGHDIRFDPSFPFQQHFVYVSLSLFFLFKLGLLIEVYLRRESRQQLMSRIRLNWKSRYTFIIGIILVSGAGFLIRLNDLSFQSLTHDEIGMVLHAEGILERGYPYKMIGSIEKLLTTYEVLPYPIALSITLFGLSDFAVRLPSLLFGTATIILIAYIGRRMFDERVGFFAALIYAFSPGSIIWAQNAFYPQQCQLATLATSYLFYCAIQSKPIKSGYLYGALALFVVTYLTWETSGFLLPAFGLALVIIKGRDFSWFRERRLWIAFGLSLLAVFFQQSRRILYQMPPHLIVGSGVSDISTPTLFFLDPGYDPLFYIKNFLWAENHVTLTVLFILGIFWVTRERGLAYFYTLLLSILFLMTNLLPLSAIRYIYFAQPFLIIIAAVVCIRIIDSVSSLGRGSRLSFLSITRMGFRFLFPMIVFLATNTFVLQLYRLSASPANPPPQTRLGVYPVDYRSTSLFLLPLLKEDDIIIPTMPHTFEYYTHKKSHYYVNIDFLKQVGYDIGGDFPGFLDKYVGNPVIRNIVEFKDVIEKHKRAWLILAPSSLLTENSDPQVIEYIERNMRVMYESYGARLYLWEK
jgi:hypothetical protein